MPTSGASEGECWAKPGRSFVVGGHFRRGCLNQEKEEDRFDPNPHPIDLSKPFTNRRGDHARFPQPKTEMGDPQPHRRGDHARLSPHKAEKKPYLNRTQPLTDWGDPQTPRRRNEAHGSEPRRE